MELVGSDIAPGEQDVEGASTAHHLWPPDSPSGAGEDPECHFGLADDRVSDPKRRSTPQSNSHPPPRA